MSAPGDDAPRAGEAFYAARGRYSPFRTCNGWAAEALGGADASS